MVIALDKIFYVTLPESAAKSIAGVGVTQQAGRAIVSNIFKAVTGVGPIVGGAVGAPTADALTETFGWVIADDFYRMSEGEEPENIG